MNGLDKGLQVKRQTGDRANEYCHVAGPLEEEDHVGEELEIKLKEME